ncbi:MAG: hypothetical protein ABIG11_04580 [bacterium]
MSLINFCRNNKTGLSVAAAAVALLLVWLLLPLVYKSSADIADSAGGPFKSRTSSLLSLGPEIPLEGQAPGAPLSDEMTDDASAGAQGSSSLYSAEEDKGLLSVGLPETSDDAGRQEQNASPVSLQGSPVRTGAPAFKGKLSSLSSLKAGNTASGAANKRANRFFGTGNNQSDTSGLFLPDKAKKSEEGRAGAGTLAMLQKSENAGKDASAGFMDADFAKSRASDAFETGGGSGKKKNSIVSGLEKSAVVSGLAANRSARSLKTNDPNLNKKTVAAPQPLEDLSKKNDEMFKKSMLQMFLSAIMQIAMMMMMRRA